MNLIKLRWGRLNDSGGEKFEEKDRILQIPYADGIVFIADNEEGMKEVISFQKFLKEMMGFRKANGRRKKISINVKGKSIEMIKNLDIYDSR